MPCLLFQGRANEQTATKIGQRKPHTDLDQSLLPKTNLLVGKASRTPGGLVLDPSFWRLFRVVWGHLQISKNKRKRSLKNEECVWLMAFLTGHRFVFSSVHRCLPKQMVQLLSVTARKETTTKTGSNEKLATAPATVPCRWFAAAKTVVPPFPFVTAAASRFKKNTHDRFFPVWSCCCAAACRMKKWWKTTNQDCSCM